MTKQGPNIYIDVTQHMPQKLESFRKHTSQWQQWGKPQEEQGDYIEKLIDLYTHRFREYGRRCGVEYAEAYISKSGKAYAHDLFPVER